ncbi:MAG: hypothetical protein AAF602_19650 [Myxococcota bacterium]
MGPLGPQPALLTALVARVYYASFEIGHLAAHLPADHRLCRWAPALATWLRERHRRHHHPDHQTNLNFNVVLPLADHLLGAAASVEHDR